MHALAREPRFRPVSAAEFAKELAAVPEVPTEPLLATAVTEPLQSRRDAGVRGSTPWFWIAGAAAVAGLAVVLGLLSLGGGESGSTNPPPVQVGTPARGQSPADEAQNLSAWLRAHSR